MYGAAVDDHFRGGIRSFFLMNCMNQLDNLEWPYHVTTSHQLELASGGYVPFVDDVVKLISRHFVYHFSCKVNIEVSLARLPNLNVRYRI